MTAGFVVPPMHYQFGRALRPLAIVLVACLVFGAEAAEWSKLKKCNDLGFCRRHRTANVAGPGSTEYTGQRDRPVYSVEPGSVKLGWWGSASALTGRLLLGDSTSALVMFAITALPDGMYRLVVEDSVKPLHARYSVKDVITDNAAAVLLKKTHVSITKERAEVAANGPDRPKAVVSFAPFSVHVYGSASEESEPLISFNGQALLHYETHITKPMPSPSPSPSPSPRDNPPASTVASTAAGESSADSPPSGDGEKDWDHDGAFEDDYADENGADDMGTAETSTPSTPSSSPDEGLWEENFQSHHDPKVRGPESVGADIAFPFAEHLYGIPERTSEFSLPHTIKMNGSVATEPYRMYNLDVFEFELHKPLGLYGAVPMLIARGGAQSAGILWLNSAETYVDVFEKEKETGRSSHWFSEAGRVDLFLIPGPTPSDIFRQYRLLTGPAAMPQRFALGYHQCRWNYRDEADARAVNLEFDRQEIPYDVLWLDIEHTNGKRYFTWDLGKFPDPGKLQSDIGAVGRKMVTIVDPHIKRDKKYELHKTAENNKYYVMTPEGSSYEGWCWPGSSSYFDFTSPTTREAWAKRFNPTDYPYFSEHLYTWVDMNEPSVFNGPEVTMPKHMVHNGGVEHRDVHNQYGFYVQQATHDGLLRGHGGNDRPFVLSRSFFAGSQRFGAVWTGDNTAAWDHLETTARMLLPLQITGIIFSGADVGGFFGNPSPELLVRWYQTGAFQPFFRGHAHIDTNRREPWLFGDDNTRLIRTAIRARYSFIPFWYTLMAANALGDKLEFENTGRGPPMRPLWWEFPEDKRVDAMDDQWMVGSSLLVAPVVKEGATERTVYLPGADAWYDLFAPEGLSRARVSSGEVKFNAPLDRMLVFQRAGSIVPKQERLRRSTRAMATDPFTLVVALTKDGSAEGELYLDDGQSFNYRKGAHTLRKFSFADSTLRASTVFGSPTFVGSDALVERIVIMGLPAGVSFSIANVVGSAHGGGEHVADVVGDAESGTAIVRKPGVRAAHGEWYIRLS